MSRRSSYGYSSYGTHSYRSGRHRNNRNGNKKRNIIIISAALIAVAAAAAALYFFFLRKDSVPVSTESSTEQSSQVSVVSQDSSEKSEVSQQNSEESVADVPENPNIKGYNDGNVFIYDKQGYEMFYGSSSTAKQYASVISSIKQSLGDKINVYNMVVPIHSAYGIPKSYRDKASDQYENIKTIYSSYSTDVKSIDVYDTMNKHKNEYIYFKTDNNWTSLGAYYGYKDFCSAAGLEPVDITKLSGGSITDFKGAFVNATKTDVNPNGNKDLASNPDIVNYYDIPGDYVCRLLERGTKEEKVVPLIATFATGSNAYSAFIWGDNPYMKIVTSNKNGKKLCIIKDSYGCAFSPYTVTNYEEIYIVDPRYYEGNIIDYIKKNKYTDVLVIDSIMTANTEVRINEMKSIIK